MSGSFYGGKLHCYLICEVSVSFIQGSVRPNLCEILVSFGVQFRYLIVNRVIEILPCFLIL